jgi:hypothetical protein
MSLGLSESWFIYPIAWLLIARYYYVLSPGSSAPAARTAVSSQSLLDAIRGAVE